MFERAAKLQSASATGAAEATLTRVESDSRGRSDWRRRRGVDQDRVQAEMNLKAQEASVQSLKDQ